MDKQLTHSLHTTSLPVHLYTGTIQLAYTLPYTQEGKLMTTTNQYRIWINIGDKPHYILSTFQQTKQSIHYFYHYMGVECGLEQIVDGEWVEWEDEYGQNMYAHISAHNAEIHTQLAEQL